MAYVRHHDREPLRSRVGDVLTEDVIEQLAIEAEAGYALEEAVWTPSDPGSRGDGSAPRISFRASRALYDAARMRAKIEGRTVSDLAREAMERYVSGERT